MTTIASIPATLVDATSGSFVELHSLVGQLSEPNLGPRPKMQLILENVAKRRRLSMKEIKSKSRERRIAWARQEFMYLAKRYGYTTTRIGNVFGFDHSTVSYGVEQHAKRNFLPSLKVVDRSERGKQKGVTND